MLILNQSDLNLLMRFLAKKKTGKRLVILYIYCVVNSSNSEFKKINIYIPASEVFVFSFMATSSVNFLLEDCLEFLISQFVL